jgi:hypothetical protein
MATSKEVKNKISLNGLVELLGFPTLPELVIDGVNLDEILYRKLIVRLAQHYLDTVRLTLSLADEDLFRLDPHADGDWNDVAYWLGNLINQESGTVKITAPSDFLRQGELKGRPYGSLAEAVLDNLDSLRNAPEVFRLGSPGDAIRKAADNALEVKKVREMVYEQAAGW